MHIYPRVGSLEIFMSYHCCLTDASSDPFETDGPGVADLSEDNDEPEVPLDDLMDRYVQVLVIELWIHSNFYNPRTEAWVRHRAALESMGESNWYIRASNGM